MRFLMYSGEKKKIAFIMHRFAGGGAERVTILLANELIKRGYDISFLVKINDGELKSEIDASITVIELGFDTKTFFKNMYKHLKKAGYHVIFSVSMGMSSYAILINRLLSNRFKLIPVIHSTMSKSNDKKLSIKSKIFYGLQKSIYTVVIVSEEARQDFIQLTKINQEKCVTIYNPIVSEQMIQISRERNDHPWFVRREYPVLVCAGRLTIEKNFDLLLEALKIINDEMTVRLIVLGEGELEHSLKKHAADLGLQDKVDFYGFTSNPYSFFRNADCFVLSSLWEGLPTVLIEAMACGCPVVSTNCVSGPSEILENGKYGCLVESGNSHALADGIKSVILRKDIDIKPAEDRSKDFQIEKSVDKYIKLIEE